MTPSDALALPVNLRDAFSAPSTAGEASSALVSDKKSNLGKKGCVMFRSPSRSLNRALTYFQGEVELRTVSELAPFFSLLGQFFLRPKTRRKLL